METPLKTLRQIRDTVPELLRPKTAEAVMTLLDMSDYHGFTKSRFPELFLRSLLQPFGLTSCVVQVEVVMVDRDLTHEVHYHREANAAVIVLGEAEHLPNPVSAQAYLGNHWFPVNVGEKLDIPAGTPHGFTVAKGGILYFLSVQSPPIERKTGHDDYTRVEAE